MVKLAVLLGYPLAHSVTPAMYAPAFAAMGIEARCEKWVTPPQDLAAAVERLRAPEVLGANVTVPHKEAVLRLLDGVDPAAAAIGAVNCIVRQAAGGLKGYNTDKDGFLLSLRDAGFEPAGMNAVLLGAGGAARAVAAGLLEAGIARLAIANRNRARAEALVHALGRPEVSALDWRGPDFDFACSAADLIVNSTPMGTANTELASDSPVEARDLRPGVCAYDLVYNPAVTPFLALAGRAGARGISGLEMLVYQGAESLRLFTGREPPIDIMRQAAGAALHA